MTAIRQFAFGCMLASLAGCYPKLATKPGESLVRKVQVIEVCATPATSTTRLIGEIEPYQENLLYFEVAGTVAEVFVQEGDEVTVGTPIARLMQDDFELAVAKAEAELEAANAKLNLLEAGTRAEDLEVAKAAHVQALVRTEYWTKELQRQTSLFQRKAATEEELEEAQREHAIAVQAERLTRAELDRAIAGPRPEELEAAVADVRAREQAVALAQRQLDKSTLRAPFDGRIEQRLIDVGAYINVFPTGGVPVVHLVDLDQVDAVVAVPELLLPRFVEHETLTIVSATERQNRFEGTILSVGRVADPASGTYPVRARFLNSAGLLTAGMVVETQANMFEDRSAVYAPLGAVFQGFGQPPHVLVLQAKEPRVAMREVELGPTVGERVEIASGLSVGDLLIVQGQDRVVPGDLVRFERSASATPNRSAEAVP